jgi:hypothetical protein
MILSGLATYVPGMMKRNKTGTGGSVSARYCYSVWLRHLVMARQAGLTRCPESIAELGPGDSLGAGMAALLSGAKRYSALDVVVHTNTERNLAIFDQLIDLFRSREPIPGVKEFPSVKPYIQDYSFPHDLVDDNMLEESLRPSRLADIRECITHPISDPKSKDDTYITYQVPWYEASVLRPESIDMVFSQAVMEYVDDLAGTYTAMHSWLKPSGISSHQIDYKCDRTADCWNGHWAYSRLVWYLANRGRLTHLNRKAHSEHLQEQIQSGFRILCQERIEDKSGLPRKKLAPAFQHLSDEDLVTSGAYILAVKHG